MLYEIRIWAGAAGVEAGAVDFLVVRGWLFEVGYLEIAYKLFKRDPGMENSLTFLLLYIQCPLAYYSIVAVRAPLLGKGPLYKRGRAFKTTEVLLYYTN